jgi:hypothetical protein
MTREEAVALWKEQKIERAEMEFYCGGDEMGDYSFTYYDAENEEVECKELDVYFDEEVFKKIDFYVNSDGHYMGESGNVHITLDDLELDDAEIDFDYVKNAQSEWNESLTNTLEIELNEEQINFLKEFVRNIIGGSDEFTQFNYSKDFIMTNEHERIEKEIGTIIDNVTTDYEPDTENEVGEWFNYESQEFMFDDNVLLIEITNETTIYRDSDD